MARHQTRAECGIVPHSFAIGVGAMPRTKKGTPPSYRRHASGQAVVTVRLADGQRHDLLLGPWDSKESRDEYNRILVVHNNNHGRSPAAKELPQPDAVTVNEVILKFWRDAERRYGPDSKELAQFRYSLRPLKRLYGTHPASKFSPKCLRAVQRA